MELHPSPFARSSLLLYFLRGLHAITGQIQFQDHTVMNQSIDGRGGGHGILEDLLPVREHQVAGQQKASLFVSMREEGKENLHFLAALLHIAQIIDEQGLEPSESLQLFFQQQIRLARSRRCTSKPQEL